MEYCVQNNRGELLAADVLAMHPSARAFRGAWHPGYCISWHRCADAQAYADALCAEGYRGVSVVERPEMNCTPTAGR